MKIYKKNFEMCKLPVAIQDSILEAKLMAAKSIKYKKDYSDDLKNLTSKIEELDKNKKILDKNFNALNWQEIFNYYFNDEIEVIKNNSLYSFLDLV